MFYADLINVMHFWVKSHPQICHSPHPHPNLDPEYPCISASCWHTPIYCNKTRPSYPSLVFNHGKYLTVLVFGMAYVVIMTNLAEIKGGKSSWICAGTHFVKTLIWTGENAPRHFLIRIAFWLTSFDCRATYSRFALFFSNAVAVVFQ